MHRKKHSAALVCLMACIVLLTGNCFATPEPIVSANDIQGNANPAPEHNNTPSAENLAKWMKLQALSSDQLTVLLGKTMDPIESAWINLALISKERISDNTKLVASLLDWRDQNPSHPGNQLFPASDQLGTLPTYDAPKRIAILLPEHGAYAISAKAIHDGFMDAYNKNDGASKKQRVKFYDTAGKRTLPDVVKLALDEGADFIVGPLTKTDVQALYRLTPLNIPVLALNYSTANNANANFYEFGLLPEDDAAQIALRAHSNHLTRALVIAPNNPWGKRLVSAFTSNWEQQGGTVQDNWYFLPKADFNTGIAALLGINQKHDEKLSRIKNNREALKQQRRQDFDVIVLFAQANEANIIVPLLKFYYAGDIPIYATSSVYANISSDTTHDLNGVIVCDVPTNNQLKTADSKLFAIGEDAYHLTQSIQRLALLPHFPLYRSSGALILDDKHQIHRRLPCLAIKDITSGLPAYASNS